jgi:hypothetical protein
MKPFTAIAIKKRITSMRGVSAAADNEAIPFGWRHKKGLLRSQSSIVMTDVAIETKEEEKRHCDERSEEAIPLGWAT